MGKQLQVNIKFLFIISKVNEIDGIDDAAQFIIHGAEVLGEAIGKFVGAFVGAFVRSL